MPRNSSSGLLLFITLISREFTSLRTKRKVKGSFEVQCSLKSYVSNRAPWGPQIMILFWGADVLWPLSSFATVTLARRGQVICRYLLCMACIIVCNDAKKISKLQIRMMPWTWSFIWVLLWPELFSLEETLFLVKSSCKDNCCIL